MRILIALSCLFVATTHTADAAVVTEIEADGTSVNNSVATAQSISASAFTLPVPGNVYNPPGFPTATVQGGNGFDDVDFYSFTVLGGRVYLDMDNVPTTFDPIIALFDSAGTLIAWSDDSELDPGSDNTVDSFLGIFNLPGAGVYYIGVSENANFPTTALTGIETPLVRPGGGSGGFAVSGVATGISTYDFNGVQPGGALYTLHVSLQAIPEPGSMLLMGTALCVFLPVLMRRTRR